MVGQGGEVGNAVVGLFIKEAEKAEHRLVVFAHGFEVAVLLIEPPRDEERGDAPVETGGVHGTSFADHDIGGDAARGGGSGVGHPHLMAIKRGRIERMETEGPGGVQVAAPQAFLPVRAVEQTVDHVAVMRAAPVGEKAVQ